jgi:putative peptidoglycan lipid II flippase
LTMAYLKSTHTECRGMMCSAGLIGGATLCSRLLGFFRDMVIARMFGVYVYAQAFVVAFRIPNLFRDIVGEGAVNSAFVPVFSQYRIKQSREEFWELANVTLNILLVILSIIVISGIIFSPYIVKAFAPGFAADPVKFQATVTLNRLVFPYLLLISLAAYTMAMLNSLGHFAAPAFAPCLLNISIIVCSLLFGESLTGMATGILAGGLLQLGIQLPFLYSRGFRIRGFMRKFSHPGAREMFRLLTPRMFGTCVYQLNNFVDSIFGSLAFIVGEGGVAVLYFAYRLVQFPVGIFGNAVSQAALPLMSAQAAEEGRREDLKKTLLLSLRHVFFFMLPSSALLMFLAHPIIRGVFQGGRFDAYASATTADALFFYSIGLFAYAGSKVLSSCFFALKDTATPVKISAVTLVMSIVLNSLLMFPLKIKGLALASSLSGIISFFLLLRVLDAKVGGIGLKAIFRSFVKMLAASILCGLCGLFVSVKLPGRAVHGFFANAGWLAVYLACGSAVYLAACMLFRCKEVGELWGWIKKPAQS